MRFPLFRAWADDFNKSTDLRPAVKLEIEAFFRRLSANQENVLSFSKKKVSIIGEPQSHHVEHMVRFVTEHFREPLTIDLIARAAGLNPEYAMRLFRNCLGVTLWAFLLQQRIAEARRLLLLGDAPIAEISFDSGFQSLGRFYQAFKKQCHCSPGAYRCTYAGARPSLHWRSLIMKDQSDL